MIKEKLLTINQQVILASSSKTRIKKLKKFIKVVKITNHKINEEKIKKIKQGLSAKSLAKYLAKRKAESIVQNYKSSYIIGCDQTLECRNRIISKPKNYEEAKENLLFLNGQDHKLFSCLYVIKNEKEFFIEQTTSHLSFKKITEQKIDSYISENKKTVLSCVGSYRIEDNKKYKFLEIIKGTEESIIGFPIKKFIEKLKREHL